MAGGASEATRAVPGAADRARKAGQATGPTTVPRQMVSEPGEAAQRNAGARAARALSGLSPAQSRSPRQQNTQAQLRPAGAGGTDFAPPDVQEGIERARGGGHALDAGLRQQLQPHFNHELGDVRLHTDARADALSRAIDARAFTVGTDIFFRAGAYAPGTMEGRALLGHELTHVDQQRGAAGTSETLPVSSPGDPNERAADAAAQQVASGSRVSGFTGTAQRQLARQSATGAPEAQPAAAAGSVKAGAEVELPPEEFSWPTDYGEIKVSITIKPGSVLLDEKGAGGFGSSSNATLKFKEGPTPGIKQGFSVQWIKARDLFKGLSFTDVSVGVEGALSGTEVSVVVPIKFNIVTSAFKAPASATGIIVKGKVGEGIKGPGFEFAIAPVEFSIVWRKKQVLKLKAEFKASFLVNPEKVLKKIAKEALKKEAEKQAGKFLSRQAGEAVLKDLGPLFLAFGVGLDIGGLLDEYTVAPKVAEMVDKDILGDLNERYQQASTLGKMFLIYSNKEKIVASLIASGVTGVVAGIGDVVLFKIMGLDKRLKEFEEALKAFVAVVKVLKVDPGGAMASLDFSNAVTMGIKFNPKHGKISDPSFAKLGQLVYEELHPLFKTKNGLSTINGLTVKDIDLPETDLSHIVKRITDEKLDHHGQVNFSAPPDSVTDSFFEFYMSTLIQFMEFNKLVKYDVSFSDDLSIDSIDPKLVAEVFN